MYKKGQVSTEYLVILAVVLVVALVVVFLLGGFSGLGATSLETQSKNSWGAASPFSITTFRSAGTTLDLEVVNNDLDRLTLTDITINGAAVYSGNTTFDSGESIVLSVTMSDPCGNPGDPYQYGDVIISYDKGLIADNTQVGIKPFVGKCS